MTWHVEQKVLEGYARNAINDAYAYSVEAHLLSCELCRSQVTTLVDHERLEAIWQETEAIAFGPKRGPVEKLLLRIGVRDHVARLLAATPSLRVSWLAAITLALTFAVASSYLNDRGYLLFLILAPMLPLAGVAAAYGPGVDPTYEIGLAAPMRSFELLLIRSVAVLISSCLLIGFAALALPQVNWAAAAWLLPALGLTSASLALGTLIKPWRAAAGVAVAWLAVAGYSAIFTLRSSATLRDVFGEILPSVLLLVTLASVAVLYGRRETFERGVLR